MLHDDHHAAEAALDAADVDTIPIDLPVDHALAELHPALIAQPSVAAVGRAPLHSDGAARRTHGHEAKRTHENPPT